jgi:cell division FtsZ-interacting protein ZapD
MSVVASIEDLLDRLEPKLTLSEMAEAELFIRAVFR